MKLRALAARLDRLERRYPPRGMSIEEARAQLYAALESALAAEQQPSRAELTGPHAELAEVIGRLTECHATL